LKRKPKRCAVARRATEIFVPALVFIAVMSTIGFCRYLFLVGKVERLELDA